MIPILYRHDSAKIIGRAEFENGKFIITFTEDSCITKEQIFKMMDCGFEILDSCWVEDEKLITKSNISKNVEYLKKIRIIEISYGPFSDVKELT